ncbi:MAG: hypothetical protein ACYST6_20610 [Planctomycetota bacterium]|jgi:hypothetical protein
MSYLESFVRKTTEIKLGGKPYKFAALTVKDWAKFKLYIKEQREADLAKQREQLLELAAKIEKLDPEKLLDRLQVTVSDEDAEAAIETFDGFGYCCWLSLLHNYKDIKLDEVSDMISIEDMPAISNAIVARSDKKKPVKARR